MSEVIGASVKWITYVTVCQLQSCDQMVQGVSFYHGTTEFQTAQTNKLSNKCKNNCDISVYNIYS